MAENYRQAIVEIAEELIGRKSVKYKDHFPELGQSPTEGFDCSGFTTFVLGKAGLKIPDYIGADNLQRPIRHANEYWDHYGVNVQHGQQEGGDLILFSRNGSWPYHIGIVKDPETYIHAPGEDGTFVEERALEIEPIPEENREGRQLYATNPIGFKAVTIAVDDPCYRYHQRLV